MPSDTVSPASNESEERPPLVEMALDAEVGTLDVADSLLQNAPEQPAAQHRSGPITQSEPTG